MRIHKCAFKHCLHNEKEIDPNEEVKENGKYYHKDCCNIKNKITNIRTYYFDNIDKNTDFVAISVVLNNMILKQHINAEFIEYTLKYIVNKKMNTLIKSPYTLYYLPKNQKFVKAYTEYKERLDKS